MRVQARPPARRPRPDGPTGRRDRDGASTAGRWARSSLTGNRAKRSRSSRCRSGSVRAVRRCRRARGRGEPNETAAVFLEPTQGEGGVRAGRRPAISPPRGRSATHSGRCWCSTRCRAASAAPGTGSRSQADGVRPDVITLAKGLGGGLPIGAASASATPASCSRRATTARTFGGNPVACAAALAVLDTIERTAAARLGASGRWSSSRPALAGDRPPAASRGAGRGLMAGDRAYRRRCGRGRDARASERALLVNAVDRDVVRLAPPLVVTEAEVDAAFATPVPALSGRRSERRHERPALPARRRPEPRRAGRGARPGRRA